MIAWTCGALACASIGRPPRRSVQLVLDWLPLVVILSAYDFTRGSADSLGIGVHVHTMIDFDRFVFFGQTPTEWLQAHLYDPGVVHWWDVCFTLVYTSYFIVPFAVAGFLWARDRLAFLRFTKRLVTLTLAGLATYIAFPAAPPWMAGEMGLLHDVAPHHGASAGRCSTSTPPRSSRTARTPSTRSPRCPRCTPASRRWSRCSSGTRVRPRWRPLLAAYPLAMGLTLMATGEHYFFDVVLGWCYAGAVMAGWAWWEGARRRLAVRTEPAPT